MKRVLVSCASKGYFKCLKALVASIHRTSDDVVDKIAVFDLGLTRLQRWQVQSWHKTRVVDFPGYTNDFFEGYLTPKQYAWKTCVLKEAGQFGDLVLYLDAGIIAVKNIAPIYDWIAEDDIFIVGDGYWRVHQWTTEQCLQIMHADAAERDAFMISAGIQGYRPRGRFQGYIDDAFRLAQIKECVHGPTKSHRHDQSIYSILCHRLRIPRYQSPQIYGEHRGANMCAEQVIYVHRGEYLEAHGLRRKWRLRP